VFDEPCGRLRQHHPAGRGYRFHPLGKSDRLACRGVSQCSRTDLTGDHPTRIQAHPQSQRHAIVAGDFDRQPVYLLLDRQGGQTSPKRVVLQRNWGTEQCHHSVAVVLHGPAVTLHHRRRALDEFGHDFA